MLSCCYWIVLKMMQRKVEDDILITETGCINLSANIPKEIEEVEALMAAAKGK